MVVGEVNEVENFPTLSRQHNGLETVAGKSPEKLVQKDWGRGRRRNNIAREPSRRLTAKTSCY